jgi:hypothetical protein
MKDDTEAQEIQGTVVSSGRFPEPAADDRTAPADAPEDQEDQEDAERPGSADPGYASGPADRTDGAEVTDPDAVIIEEVDEAPADEVPADETTADETTADEATADDDAPEPVAGFARTPVASPADAAADAVPEPDVIAEANRPGVPQDREVPAAGGLVADPGQLHERWTTIQSSFVDDPRASVAAAAELVSEAIEALMTSVQERERGLRGEWEQGGTDTEDLRNTLRGYRGLLDQLAAR